MSIKFSLIVPTYNREDLLKETINSIKNQSYTNYELFIVDNESKDNTYNVALEYQCNNIEVHKVENIYPCSYDEAKNYILPKCTGDYITFIADDDILQNNYLQKLNDYITNSNFPQALQSPIKWYNPTTQKVLKTVSYYYKNILELKNQLLFHCCINTPTFVFNKELKDTEIIKGRPEKFLGAADYDLYFRLVDSGIFIETCSDWLGYYYRYHGEQATWTMVQNPNHVQDIKQPWIEKWK